MLISPATPHIPVVTPITTAVVAVASTETEKKSSQQNDQNGQSDRHSAKDGTTSRAKSVQSLSSADRAEIQQLAQRDREVRAHEAAHKGAAGRYARGGAQFDYQRGPDGRRYAVGGEVGVDISRLDDPAATLQKALILRRAALAPAQPSAQDRSVAAEATRMAAEAQAELLRENIQNRKDEADSSSSTTANSIEQAYSADNNDKNAQIDFTV